MDNAQKAIMIGVGLFITIIIISAVLLITTYGTNLMNSATSNLTGVEGILKEQLLNNYDNITLNGSGVNTILDTYSGHSSVSVIVYPNTNVLTSPLYLGAGVLVQPTGTQTVATLVRTGGSTGWTIGTGTPALAATVKSSIVSAGNYRVGICKDAASNVLGIVIARVS